MIRRAVILAVWFALLMGAAFLAFGLAAELGSSLAEQALAYRVDPPGERVYLCVESGSEGPRLVIRRGRRLGPPPCRERPAPRPKTKRLLAAGHGTDFGEAGPGRRLVREQ